MKIPKVSIILPTYNGEKYIRQSIDSCLNQTFHDFELIVIDDCSKDATAEIVKSYKDKRIKYRRNSSNQRLPKSLNIGFELAQGEYLTWTSDDNLYLPNAIEKMLKAADFFHCDFVYTDIYALEGEDMKNAMHIKLDNYDKINVHNCIRACFLYSRRVKETIGDYDPDTELIEDYDYWVRISKKFYMHHIPEPLYYYRYHPNSLWCSKTDEIKVMEFLFKFKHQFAEKDIINWGLRNFMLEKSKSKNFISQLWSKFLYQRKIDQILSQYTDRRLTFSQASKNLNRIINHV